MLLSWLAAVSLAAAAVDALPLPTPTPEQLAWSENEIMALVHFNMATFFQNGDPGCDAQNWHESSKPSSFAPTHLDTDNWAASMQALGAKEAVLTAKHGCGFAIWPTAVLLPDGSPYGYHVPADLDVLKRFASSMESHGIGHGFYYSLTNNYYLNVCSHNAGSCEKQVQPGQLNVTQAEFEAIAIQQMTELWTMYGNLTEIWFDGGYTGDMKTTLTSLLRRTQPRVVANNGGGLATSTARWVGTEGDMDSGYEKGVWSTYCCNQTGPNEPCVVAHSSACALNYGPYGGGGCPATGAPADAGCNYWYPAALDYTLQADDDWFWEPAQPLRPPAELIAVYHQSVGRNTKLEMDFAIDRTGRVDPAHAALYATLGGWIRSCYGSPVAEKSSKPPTEELWISSGSPNVWSLELDLGAAVVDRVVIREDQAYGQRILAYKVYAIASDGTKSSFSNGTAVGNKRIDLHNAGGVSGSVVLEVMSTAMDLPVVLKSFAAFTPCSDGSTPEAVSYSFV